MRAAIKTSVLFFGVLLPFRPNYASEISGFAQEFVAAHNRYRAGVGNPPLVWSDRLAERAQRWARTLIARGRLQHSGGEFGENLFEIAGGSATPESVVDDWASEQTSYDHETNRCDGQCGHYTQIVWRDTKRVGCAVARKARREIWVCEYDPPGNVIGERPY